MVQQTSHLSKLCLLVIATPLIIAATFGASTTYQNFDYYILEQSDIAHSETIFIHKKSGLDFLANYMPSTYNQLPEINIDNDSVIVISAPRIDCEYYFEPLSLAKNVDGDKERLIVKLLKYSGSKTPSSECNATAKQVHYDVHIMVTEKHVKPLSVHVSLD